MEDHDMKIFTLLSLCLLQVLGATAHPSGPSVHQGSTWHNANHDCRTKYNSSLIVLNDTNLGTVLNFNNFQNGQKYWVGLLFINDTLQWINGVKVNGTLTYGVREFERIKNDNKLCFYFKRTGHCKRDNFTTNIKRCIKSDHCNSTHGFICESSLKTETGANDEASTHSISKTTASSLSTSVEKTTTANSTSPSTIQICPSSSLLSGDVGTSSIQTTPTPPVRGTSSSVEVDPTTERPSNHQVTSPHIVSSSTTSINMETTSPVITPTKVNHFREVMDKVNTSDPECMTVLLGEYDDLSEWIDKQDEAIEYNPLTVAQQIENIALEFTKLHLTSNGTRVINISNKNIAFHAKLVDSDTDSDVVFPEASEDSDVNNITLPKSLFKGQDTYIVNVVLKNNKTIRQFIPKVMEGVVGDNMKWFIGTHIFSTAIFPTKNEPFEDVVKINLQHVQKKKPKYAKAHGAFWNFSIPTSSNGSWSQRGCRFVSTSDTHTEFACNHFTNFAVLMQLNAEEPDPVHQQALTLITYIGLGLSLLGEVTTVLLYYVFLNLRHEKIQIRVNLLCALAAAQIVFLAGIDKTENKDVCTFVAAMIHFFYLVSFCWMLMEGVYLYRMVVKVFDAHVTLRYSYLFACGFPLCVVAVSLVIATFVTGGIHTYIDPKYCWIQFNNGLIWSFCGPILLLIAINIFFLFSVLKEIASMKYVKTINSFELSSLKASARACVVLLPLLGITWVFGFLTIISTGVEWQYIFTVLNATQGFLIFIFHCLRNTELRAAMELRYYQWEISHSNHYNQGRVTPSRGGKQFVSIKNTDKGRSNTIPMTTTINKVAPE